MDKNYTYMLKQRINPLSQEMGIVLEKEEGKELRKCDAHADRSDGYADCAGRTH